MGFWDKVKKPVTFIAVMPVVISLIASFITGDALQKLSEISDSQASTFVIKKIISYSVTVPAVNFESVNNSLARTILSPMVIEGFIPTPSLWDVFPLVCAIAFIFLFYVLVKGIDEKNKFITRFLVAVLLVATMFLTYVLWKQLAWGWLVQSNELMGLSFEESVNQVVSDSSIYQTNSFFNIMLYASTFATVIIISSYLIKIIKKLFGAKNG